MGKLGLFRESGEAVSRRLAVGWGLEPECEESLDAVVAANGIGSHESELEEEMTVIAVAAPAPDERLPVVIEASTQPAAGRCSPSARIAALAKRVRAQTDERLQLRR